MLQLSTMRAAVMAATATHIGGVSDYEWAQGLVADFPRAWAGRMLTSWQTRHDSARQAANLAHLATVRKIETAHRAGVRADANDAELCQVAAEAARDMQRRIGQRDMVTRRTIEPAGSPWVLDWIDRAALLAAYAEAMHWLRELGLQDIGQRMRGRLQGVLGRLCCERWWRRVLRRLHAQAVEGAARVLGLVHKRAGCYVSDESARRRAGQIKRNARALESVEAVNEQGQRYTLAELASRGPANREIRRHELMTRIAGFEQIAKDCGHVAYMVTVTCPSRMHAWRTRPGSTWATQANPSFDGTTPDQAQQHLTGQWARFRAAAQQRAGLGIYGFRIAEPNHDGTPHWHILLFLPQRTEAGRLGYRMLVRLLRRYFYWQADPGERGARHHRIQLERIDWQRGSAAGYVAKYVAKNIDGYRVERDLYGNEALHASQRVDAWASTWRVRQFQQVGGAPVGVWRELRRLHPEQAAESDLVAQALEAVNIAARGEAEAHSDTGRRYTAAHGWAEYVRLQGGPTARRRSMRLRVLREATGECGRYGDVVAPRAVGVVAVEQITETRPALGIVPAMRVTRDTVAGIESERATWIVVPKGTPAAALPAQPAKAGGEAERPWSPVNNCTRALDAARALAQSGALKTAPGALFMPQARRVPKLGRWFSWKRGEPTKAKHAEPQSQDDRR